MSIDGIIAVATIGAAIFSFLTGTHWIRHLRAERPARRRAMALNLARRAGPPALGGLVVMAAGEIIGLSGHIALGGLIAVMGLTWGLLKGLEDVRRQDRRFMMLRLAVTIALTAFLAWQLDVH